MRVIFVCCCRCCCCFWFKSASISIVSHTHITMNGKGAPWHTAVRELYYGIFLVLYFISVGMISIPFHFSVNTHTHTLNVCIPKIGKERMGYSRNGRALLFLYKCATRLNHNIPKIRRNLKVFWFLRQQQQQ